MCGGGCGSKNLGNLGKCWTGLEESGNYVDGLHRTVVPHGEREEQCVLGSQTL